MHASHRRLSQEGLKAIACITMLIDHSAVILFQNLMWMRAIGRIAFPIFCFLLTEGFYHTRDRKKYGLRLFLFALISEFPYDFAFSGGIDPGSQNVMLTLFFGFLGILILEEVKNPLIRSFSLLACYLVPALLLTDYGGEGVLMVLLFAISRKTAQPLFTELLGLLALSLLIGGYGPVLLGVMIPLEAVCIFSLIPIRLYSGSKSSRSSLLKWGFYWFYPVHLVILKCIQVFG